MKKLISFLMILVLFASLTPLALAEGFSATTAGFGGDVTVTLKIEGDKLTEVIVVGDSETEGIGSRAVETLPQLMLDTNLIDVDTVSGATVTSTAIKTAAAEALAQSGATLTKVETDDTLSMTPGVYTGVGQGIAGDISVEIEVTENAITKVTVGEQRESENIGTLAYPILTKSIVDNQSLVDTVAGATFTSNGVKAAVQDAMQKAGATNGAIAAFSATPMMVENPGDTQTDVVVVGAGLAGMVAAMKLKDAGVDVILLEKTGMTGGSARLSHSAIWSIGAEETSSLYDFNANEIYGFFNKQATPVSNKEVFYKLANLTGEGMDYLKENGLPILGVEFSHQKMDPRFRAIDTVGFGPGLAEAVTGFVQTREIDLRYDTPMIELVRDESGAISGVVAEHKGNQYTITAKKVILATGGFTYNDEMLAEYGAGLDKNNMKISAIGGTGDGHIAGLEAGGYLVGEGVLNLYCVDGMPECFFNEMGALFGAPLIVDDDGDQMAAIDEHYTTICKKMTLLNNGYGNVIVGSDQGDAFVPLIERMIAEGTAVKGDTIEELAGKLGMDAARLTATIENNNMHFDAQTIDDWTTAAERLVPIKQGPYYSYKLCSTVMGTITGLAVNEQMQVMTQEGEPVSNLYAIGELMFGNVFNMVYPMSGTALTMCVTSGIVSAEDAAQSIK